MSRGEVEADESYFGGYRKGRRGRGQNGSVWALEAARPRLYLPGAECGSGHPAGRHPAEDTKRKHDLFGPARRL
jgi:hypothetical protein